MKVVGWYVLTVVVMVAVVGAVAAAFTLPENRWVVVLSAAVAIGTQTAALLVARAFSNKDQVFVGWGLGSLMRLTVLVLFWLVVSRLWRPTVNVALLSLVSMLFVTMVVEPLFLRK